MNVARILIDADGCPVVDETISIAKQHDTECIILCDTSHIFEKDGASTLTFSKGNDSVDFALVNMVCKNDIVVTQDYGLAAMCLARNALVLNQDGMRYTSSNIDALLYSRHMSAKLRRSGVRTKGNYKRNVTQDENFKQALLKMLEGIKNE